MIKVLYVLVVCCMVSTTLVSQNDIDALRYSQTVFGGTSRSKAMAGSFGALGADGSCMGINPAGIGLYSKGDINLSFGLRFYSVDATHNGTSNKQFKANVPFDGLTLVGAWDGKDTKDNHHALGLSCSQIANFNSNISIEGSSNHKSMMDDILATAKGKTVPNLASDYAGLAYESYLLDTINGKYYSFVNTKYNVKQSKSIETSGRINEWCFNYAYGYKDKLYIGATLGIPSVSYNYSSTYSETDDKDSIRITNYNYPVYYYTGSGGFKSLGYQETYTTTGSGYNLKLGVIYRASKFIRMGVSFHTPTVYNLTDTYVYKMTSSFDEGGNFSSQYPPQQGGRFNYKVKTPMKLIGSLALLYQKYGAINIDYELIDYKKASLQSNPQEFSDVNQTIRNKYAQTSNVRVGAEANLKPLLIRLGYAMYGSPFGATFSGNFVKIYYTGGIGFRKNKLYVDISFTKSISSESYYMYNPNYVDQSNLTNSGTTIALSIGSKF